jgi:hypothetical protein
VKEDFANQTVAVVDAVVEVVRHDRTVVEEDCVDLQRANEYIDLVQKWMVIWRIRNGIRGVGTARETQHTLSERRLRVGRVGVWLGPGFAGKQFPHGIDGV